MGNEKLVYLSRLKDMSYEQFAEEEKSDMYIEISKDISMRKEFMEMRKSRMANKFKRERVLEALYSSPVTLEWINNIQKYRELRIEQAWISIALRDGEKDLATKSSWEMLDKKRRSVHNQALKSFCKLIEKTSPNTNRDNMPPSDGSLYLPRNEKMGDIYDGPLMIPEEEPDKYGPRDVREAMTKGMFRFLKLIEETHRSDWDIDRKNVMERLAINMDAKLPDIMEIQADLKRIIRGFGMSESPVEDEFSTNLFDEKDNKYRNTNKKGFDRWDER